jgi:hypothetical protein
MRGYPDQGLCRRLADQFTSRGWDQGASFSGRFGPSLFARPRPFRNCSRVHLWQEKKQIGELDSDY